MNKLTKVVATIGPASNSDEKIKELIKSGVNVFRQNFSHGNKEAHLEVANRIRSIAKEIKVAVSILQDLAGPKMRTGSFANDLITLKKGQVFTLTSKQMIGTDSIVSINYHELINQVAAGDIIKLDDGKIWLQVTSINTDSVVTKVLEGGTIKSRRGINVPGVALSIDVFTPADKINVGHFVNYQYDWVSLSFVQTADDIIGLRSYLGLKGITSKIIAKIETAEALKNINAIIEASDGIMVARGDLAIETPVSLVPIEQKEIIKKCRAASKPVIVATQMLESMMDSPVPTRAEVSDIANAILDGADAVMLSGETAAGNYPIRSVQAMVESAIAVETSKVYLEKFRASRRNHHIRNNYLANSIFELATAADVSALVIVTQSGQSALDIAKLRSGLPIYALTPTRAVAQSLNVSHGITPLAVTEFPQKGSDLRDWLPNFLIKNTDLKSGNKILVSFGQEVLVSGSTDTISIVTL